MDTHREEHTLLIAVTNAQSKLLGRIFLLCVLQCRICLILVKNNLEKTLGEKNISLKQALNINNNYSSIIAKIIAKILKFGDFV